MCFWCSSVFTLLLVSNSSWQVFSFNPSLQLTQLCLSADEFLGEMPEKAAHKYSLFESPQAAMPFRCQLVWFKGIACTQCTRLLTLVGHAEHTNHKDYRLLLSVSFPCVFHKLYFPLMYNICRQPWLFTSCIPLPEIQQLTDRHWAEVIVLDDTWHSLLQFDASHHSVCLETEWGAKLLHPPTLSHRAR